MSRSDNGLTPSYGAVDQVNGNAFINTGREFVHVKNINPAQRTLTVLTPATLDGLAVAELLATIPADDGDKMIGPFPPQIYNQVDGKVYLDWSASADLSVAIVRMP